MLQKRQLTSPCKLNATRNLNPRVQYLFWQVQNILGNALANQEVAQLVGKVVAVEFEQIVRPGSVKFKFSDQTQTQREQKLSLQNSISNSRKFGRSKSVDVLEEDGVRQKSLADILDAQRLTQFRVGLKKVRQNGQSSPETGCQSQKHEHQRGVLLLDRRS